MLPPSFLLSSFPMDLQKLRPPARSVRLAWSYSVSTHHPSPIQQHPPAGLQHYQRAPLKWKKRAPAETAQSLGL
ncbi:hypothetical protein VZT92_018834 [Zoarces viviparus]|uniref:Uncharacterized protein n=1 Tax=Zoarces viviparus TaxID=48416 RepID=A0AAW1EIG2_ZOAVI